VPELTAPTEPTQRGLVERAQGGDADAFAWLVHTHLDAAWRLVRAIGGADLDPDDVVQEAFLLVWRDLPRLRDPDAFEGWLRAVLVHATHHALRRRRPVRLIALDAAEPARADPGSDPAGLLARRDLLERAFGRLSLEQRTVLALHYLDGRPLEAIAGIIGRPVGTVKSRLHGAREALRAALRAEER
jgi:RNA polymerase sigma-70 factor, ECF subfamily